jgi:protein-tyrosine phosphatase
VIRRLPLTGTKNTRDLGGYPVPGGVTAWGRTFRSDAPINLPPEDIETLKRLDITTHIDLRTQEEVEKWPSSVQSLPGFHYHHVDLCACMQMMPDTEEGVAVSYFEMTQQTEPMARIFHIIAKAEGGLLFHCAVGKDRTGVVAAILLMLAGVPRQELLADYILTAAYMREPARKLLQSDPDIPAFIVTPRIEYIETFLNRFEGEYQTAERYLASIGIPADEIKFITQRLTVLTSTFRF